MLIVLLTACNPFAEDDPKWIYAETPIPSIEERGGKPLVITVGDSIAAGWQDCRDTVCSGIELDWWQEALGDQAIVLSRGIGNSTTADLLARWEQDTKGADIVIIMSGINDVARHKDADSILNNFEDMHRRAIDAGILPIFTTIMPSDTTEGDGLQVVVAVNAKLLSHEDWLIMDIYSEMSDPNNPGYLRREEIVRDGSAHPNAAGYAHMAAFVREWWQKENDKLKIEN